MHNGRVGRPRKIQKIFCIRCSYDRIWAFYQRQEKKSLSHFSIVNWAEFLNHKTVHIHRKIIYPVWLTEQSTGYFTYVTSEEKPESICISLLGLPKQSTTAWWLRQWKFFLQFWRLEVWDPGVPGFGFFQALSLWLCIWSSSLSSHSLSSLYACVVISSCKDNSHFGLGHTLVDSFLPNFFL